MLGPTCLPVHSGRGLRMAGTGTVPSQSSMFMRMLNMRSFSMKVSRLSMRLRRLSKGGVAWHSYQVHPGSEGRRMGR